MPASSIHGLILAAAALVLALGHSNKLESCSPKSQALLQTGQQAGKRPGSADPLRAPLEELDAQRNRSAASLLEGFRSGDATQTDTIATDMMQQGDAPDLMSSAAAGVASMAALALNSGSASAMKSLSLQMASDIISTAASMVNPLLGIVVTLASSFISGLFGGRQDNPMQDLYNQIMTAVGELIQQTLIENQMDSVKDQLLATSEELLWVPDLVESSGSSDVELSYFLTVQHDLAVGARGAFGDCYDDRSSGACQSWEEAGSLSITNNYAMTHLDILTTLYSMGLNTTAFNAQIRSRLTIVGKRYRCLLQHSWETYRDFRLSKIERAISTRRRRVPSSCSGRKTYRYYECKDSWTEVSYYGQYFCSRNEDDARKNAADAECASQRSDGEVRDKLVEELRIFPSLTDFLSAADKNSPCA